MTIFYGKTLLLQPFFNKGTAFTEDERKKYKLQGLLPAAIESLETQVETIYEHLNSLVSDYAKNLYLLSIYDSNRVLYYAVVNEHMEELLPIIYTPTIAEAVTNFSRDTVLPHEAAYLDTDRPEEIKNALKAASEGLEQVDIMVITDGEGVLGIGDWGVGGLMISIGKLAVYTIAAGLNPQHVLPVVIDNGTEREELLNDPYYLGKKKPRKTGKEYLDYIEKFINSANQLFPEVLFHWEDFGRGNAAAILTKYQEKVTTFNDDIQGSGIMMVAAVDAVAEITKKSITKHRFVVFGGGTAGVGVSDLLRQEMILSGMSEQESYKHFYLVDRQGLLTENLSDLTEGQRRYARSEKELENLTNLDEIIDSIKPSVLIGCSGQAGAFNETVIKKMADYSERPAILPISNPTALCEAKAEDLIHWTKGKALIVTGSPSKPVIYKGTSYTIGQANNALLYPGLGLGIVVAKAKIVTKNMLSKAASAISELQDLSKIGAPILPPMKYVKEASRLVAEAVVAAAIEDGVASRDIKDIKTAVAEEIWKPEYKE